MLIIFCASYRRSQDLDELYNMTSSGKSQASSDNNFQHYKSNKSFDLDAEELLLA